MTLIVPSDFGRSANAEVPNENKKTSDIGREDKFSKNTFEGSTGDKTLLNKLQEKLTNGKV